MNVAIRAERAGDEAEITEVTQAAFEDLPQSSQTEHLIVDALRTAEQLVISLVAEENEEIIGHIAVSPVEISDGSSGWYGIGPVSVWPACQGRGIGSRLIREALVALQDLGAAGCVLLGEPELYSRFGFKPASSLVLVDVPPEFFQYLAFTDVVPCGEVWYRPAFAAGLSSVSP